MPAKIIGAYELAEKLGGSISSVYRAIDTRTQRDVALKVIPMDFPMSPADKERVIAEAKNVSALAHPAIVPYLELGDSEKGEFYAVMDLFKGETLKSRLARQERMHVDDAVNIIGQISQALAVAHAQGLVHRDIMPGNIFLAEGGAVKLLNFGLEKMISLARTTRTGTSMGNIEYLSPEQAQGLNVDARADIWALGVIIYEMLAGTSPFIASNQAAVINNIINHPPRPIGDVRSGLPPLLQDIVAKALCKNPVDRYQKIEDLKGNLDALDTSLAMATAAFSAPVFEAATTHMTTAIRKPAITSAPAAQTELPSPVAATSKPVISAPPIRRRSRFPWLTVLIIIITAGALLAFNWSTVERFINSLISPGAAGN